MQNVTYITYKLLLQLLFNLIQEHHVAEKKEEEPIPLNAISVFSLPTPDKLRNLFHLHHLVAWNVQIAISDKLRLR
jgi:hypothetical protein